MIPAGSVVVGRIIAVPEAEQKEGKTKKRNDRLVVTPWDMVAESPMLPETSFDSSLKEAIDDFFVKYNEAQGKQFRPLSFGSSAKGIQFTREAAQAASNKHAVNGNNENRLKTGL